MRFQLPHFCLIAALMGASLPSFSSVLRVPEDYPRIQLAIAAASAGDTVSVAPGLYRENVDFLGKSITVVSRSGASATVIDANNSGCGVQAFINGNATARLEGFTVRNGRGTVAQPGGGLRVSGRINIRDCVIESNQGYDGAGARVFGSNVAFLNCIIRDNRADAQGGGVYDSGIGTQYLGCQFLRNQAGLSGGAVFAIGRAQIQRSTFRANTAVSFGGGLYLAGTLGHLVQTSTLEDNGTVQFIPGGTVYETFAGGAIYTSSANATIARCRLTSNQASRGGGLYVAGTGLVLAHNNVIDNNLSFIGGGICLNDSRPVVLNCTVVQNSGGLYTTFAAAPVVENTILAGNQGGIVTNIDIYGAGQATVRSSLVGQTILNGVGVQTRVIVGNPLLASDFRLRAGSPAIDAGDSTAVHRTIFTDFLGQPRFFNDPQTPDTGIGRIPVDIGAIEFFGKIG